MAPISLGARAVSEMLSSPSITPTSPNLMARAAQVADSSISSDSLLSRALSHLKRQSSGIVAIPTTYAGLNSGPAPGVVAGIVLGSVGGTILLLYLIFTVVTLSGGRRTVIDEEVIRRRSVSRSRSPARTRRRRSRSVSEVVEVRERPRTRERIVVEERRTESRPPPVDDDIVEVIEEHSPPRRHRSKRDSGYRTVDPAEFGGGGRPMRKVRR